MKTRYLARLNERLDEYFGRYADQLDVAPALRFGTEAYIQAGFDLGLIEEDELAALKQQAYRNAFTEIDGAEVNSTVLNALKGDIFLPAIMKRAPVKPTTSS